MTGSETSSSDDSSSEAALTEEPDEKGVSVSAVSSPPSKMRQTARPVGGHGSSLWTDQRRRLQTAIARQDSLSAELYGRAVDALSETPQSASALVIAGHCIRDLVNRLPERLADVGPIPARADMRKAADRLEDVWRSYEENSGPSPTVDATAKGEGSDTEPMPVPSFKLVSVPLEVIDAVREVVRVHLEGRTTARARYSPLVVGRVQVSADPTVKRFHESVAAFEQMRHPSRSRQVELSANTVPDLVKHLEFIEGVIQARLGSFFQTVEDLTDILSLANARAEEETSS